MTEYTALPAPPANPVLFSTLVSARGPALCLSLFLLAACGGSNPTGPGGSPTPPAGSAVSGVVYYDENGNGALDPSESVRLPGVTVTVGGRTGQSAGEGRFTVSSVPSGVQLASANPDTLPAYFTTGEAATVSVPASGQVSVPATLAIGRNRPNVYLAFGDSITAGNGAETSGGYPDYLHADLKTYWGAADMINEGVPGTKSDQGESRLTALLGRHRPAYVLILYGTNDWNDPECRNHFPCYTITALRSMILQARDAQAWPILGTIPPVNPAYVDKDEYERNAWVTRMNKELRTMAQQERVAIAEIHDDFMAQPSLTALFADFLHPNDAGYQVMARSWREAITRPLGAGSSSRGGSGFPSLLGFSGP
jgi:lysophospholipase L1-like esterase